MDEIISLAERLGKAIAASPQAEKLNAARKALGDEPGTTQLLEGYNAQARKIAQLEEDNKPIDVEDKHKLQSLHEKLIASEAFKQYTAAQVEYVDLMRKVNEAISTYIADANESDRGE